MKLHHLFLLMIFFSCQKNNKSIGFELYKKDDLVFNKNKKTDDGSINLNGLDNGRFQEFLFIKSTDYPTNIVKTNANELYFIYNKYYQYKFHNYSQFLYNVLNFKIIIPHDLIDSDDIIGLDVNIIGEYEKSGLDYILKRYTYNEDKKIFLNKTLNEKEKITIIYILYINAYQYHFDDHNAQEWFVRQNSLKYMI